MSAHANVRVRLEFEGRTLYEASFSELPEMLRIGRAADCRCRIPSNDKSASAHHARLEKTDKGLFISDDASKNGIFCGRDRVGRRKVEPGEVYAIGECRLFAEADESVAGRAAFAHHKLEQLSGAEKGHVWNLEKPLVKVGSDFDADIRIPDLMVSRCHASFETKPDGSCWVKDMGSRNGTKVNGIRLTADAVETGRMLKDGDIVSVAYVDYRFLDKRIVHVRSHFLRNCMAVLLTLALSLGIWFGYRTMAPDAVKMRLIAEQLASEGLFDRAESMLLDAREARGADEDADRRGEMMRKIRLWKETAETWKEVKRDLASDAPNYAAINSTVSSLVSVNNDNWKWNVASAPAEGRKARAAHDVLATYMVAFDGFSTAEPTVERIKSLFSDCVRAQREGRLAEEPTLGRALADLDDLIAEMRKTLDEHEALMDAMSGFDAIEKAGDAEKRLALVYSGYAARAAERKKAARPVSSLVDNAYSVMREPVEQLRRSFEVLEENARAVARLDYGAFRAELPLPGAQKCFCHSSLPSRRAELITENANLAEVMRQIKNFQLQFAAAGLELNRIPIDFSMLVDEDRLREVYACDCLRYPMPGYAERKSTSIYDEMLGVHVFYSYLSSLDDDFDTSIIEDRFKPTIFKVPEILATVEAYRTFIYGEGNKQLFKTVERVRTALTVEQGSRVLEWADYSGKLLDVRKSFVRRLYRKFISDGDRRDGVIAGGMACVLRGTGTEFLPNDIESRVFEKFRALRRTVGSRLLSEEQRTPTQRSRLEAEVLATGIPGDNYLKQAWADAFKKEVLK